MAFRKTKSQQGFDLADVKEFGKALRGTSGKWGDLGRHFSGPNPVFVVRAPARLDLMGGMANRFGSWVCEFLPDVAVVMGVQKRRDRKIRIYSANAEARGLSPAAEWSLDDFCRSGKPVSFAQARRLLTRDAAAAWAAHVVAPLCALLHDKTRARPSAGVNVVIASDIPWSVGLGASTALEVAAAQGLGLAYDLRLSPEETVRLAHAAARDVAAADDGVMNHLVVARGQRHCLSPVLCQPDRLEAPAPLPDAWEVVAVNSQVEHRHDAPECRLVRAAAAMGHRIIVAELEREDAPASQVEAVRAYLCNLSSKDFKARYESRLPTEMRGAEFLKQYGELEDAAPPIEPDASYPVRSRTGHLVYENERVKDFLRCAERARDGDDEEAMMEAGRLMYGSHWSYRTRCALDCMLTNFLVRMARNIGIAKGIYGAKITGSGLGGTVAVLGRRGAVDEGLDELLRLYRERMEVEAEVFRGSSPGALEFGYEKYKPTLGNARCS